MCPKILIGGYCIPLTQMFGRYHLKAGNTWGERIMLLDFKLRCMATLTRDIRVQGDTFSFTEYETTCNSDWETFFPMYRRMPRLRRLLAIIKRLRTI